jgi:hypothetical protein
MKMSGFADGMGTPPAKIFNTREPLVKSPDASRGVERKILYAIVR